MRHLKIENVISSVLENKVCRNRVRVGLELVTLGLVLRLETGFGRGFGIGLGIGLVLYK